MNENEKFCIICTFIGQCYVANDKAVSTSRKRHFLCGKLQTNKTYLIKLPARSHTFVEIDHEIISTIILLPSADSFKKGCCQLQAKVCAQITG